MDTEQSKRLTAALAQGKDELDQALAKAKEIGAAEALDLGYVELIEIVLATRGIEDFRQDLESYYKIYEMHRIKGEDTPDPPSKGFLEKFARLHMSGSYYKDFRERFLESWCLGFREVISHADARLQQSSIIPPPGQPLRRK